MQFRLTGGFSQIIVKNVIFSKYVILTTINILSNSTHKAATGYATPITYIMHPTITINATLSHNF